MYVWSLSYYHIRQQVQSTMQTDYSLRYMILSNKGDILCKIYDAQAIIIYFIEFIFTIDVIACLVNPSCVLTINTLVKNDWKNATFIAGPPQNAYHQHCHFPFGTHSTEILIL